MNSLQIHVSENLGYRLESKHYPEITSIEHLSNQDISDILDYAKLFYVDVIPSFNVIRVCFAVFSRICISQFP